MSNFTNDFSCTDISVIDYKDEDFHNLNENEKELLNLFELEMVPIPFNYIKVVEDKLFYFMMKISSIIISTFKTDSVLLNRLDEYPSEVKHIILSIFNSFLKENLKSYIYLIISSSSEVNFFNGKEANESSENNKFLIITSDCFKIKTDVSVENYINDMIKVVYKATIKFSIDIRISFVQVSFENINYKHYLRKKFYDKINSPYSSSMMTQGKNLLVFEGNIENDIFYNLSNIVIEVNKDTKELHDLKETFFEFIYTKNNNHMRLKRDKPFCFEKSIKSPLNFNCLFCFNHDQTPIFRIYFGREDHKKCRIHACEYCYHKLISTDMDVRCPICRSIVINFKKISRVKGGKDKKVYESNDIIEIDMY